MRKHIAYFTMGGLKWDCFVENEKTRAADRLYCTDRDQLEINVASEAKGFVISHDKITEHLLRGILSVLLRLIGEQENKSDEYLIPFSALLHQFIKTDTFDGKSGEFYLGGACWQVINDKTYTFHRDVNGECDSNIGRIILELFDMETMKPRIAEYVRMIYIHEVVHAILCQMGLKHEEKFVCAKGLLLYEMLTSLVMIDNNKEIKMWPRQSVKKKR